MNQKKIWITILVIAVVLGIVFFLFKSFSPGGSQSAGNIPLTPEQQEQVLNSLSASTTLDLSGTQVLNSLNASSTPKATNSSSTAPAKPSPQEQKVLDSLSAH